MYVTRYLRYFITKKLARFVDYLIFTKMITCEYRTIPWVYVFNQPCFRYFRVHDRLEPGGLLIYVNCSLKVDGMYHEAEPHSANVRIFWSRPAESAVVSERLVKFYSAYDVKFVQYTCLPLRFTCPTEFTTRQLMNFSVALSMKLPNIRRHNCDAIWNALFITADDNICLVINYTGYFGSTWGIILWSPGYHDYPVFADQIMYNS